MATKIRLQRFGKKGKPLFHVVVADSRAPRDGKFIERLGSYNPNTNPATIEINFVKTLDWVNKGAEPTDTARAILSYKGVLYKKHLQGGVKKGALTEEQADAKFAQWVNEKDSKIAGKISNLSTADIADKKAQLEGLEELLDDQNISDSDRYSRTQEIRRLKAEIQNLEVQL